MVQSLYSFFLSLSPSFWVGTATLVTAEIRSFSLRALHRQASIPLQAVRDPGGREPRNRGLDCNRKRLRGETRDCNNNNNNSNALSVFS